MLLPYWISAIDTRRITVCWYVTIILLWQSYVIVYNVIDVDECQNTTIAPCDQLCVNTVGSYECRCTSGHELQQDGQTCEGQGIIIAAVFLLSDYDYLHTCTCHRY